MKEVVIKIFFSFLLKPFLRYIIGVNFDHPKELFEKLPPPYIIVANHNSHIDTAVILAALPNHLRIKTHPTAAADYFKNPLLRAVLSLFFNAVYIRRSSIKALEDMQRYLDSGHSLLIFPEGSRGTPDQLSQFKRGVGHLLKNNPHIPYIPFYLSGMGKILPKDDGLVVPFSSSVQIGCANYIKSNDVDQIMDEIYTKMMELKND